MRKKDLQFELYKKMYLIRKTEERICQLYSEDEMRTPIHICIGAEAIAAGVCLALGPQDQIFGTYRSHGIYLCKTGETDKFFAELYGKAAGLAKGKAGSMHLSAPEAGFMGTSAIVGGIIPVALGAAFANKRCGNGKTTAVFFGDGAIDEGAFWESLNMACVMKLPILFVCEDNGFACYTHKSFRHGYGSIADIVSQFYCNVIVSKTTDAELIYRAADKAKRLIRKNKKPAFLYLHYYRYLEHVGVNRDFGCTYRLKKDFEKWYKIDPVNLLKKKLLKSGVNTELVSQEENRIDGQIENSIKLAKNAPFPDQSELCKDVYV